MSQLQTTQDDFLATPLILNPGFELRDVIKKSPVQWKTLDFDCPLVDGLLVVFKTIEFLIGGLSGSNRAIC